LYKIKKIDDKIVNMDKKENILKQIFFDKNNNWERFQIENQKNIKANAYGKLAKNCLQKGFKMLI
jgi:hypothetical protein